MKLAPIAFVMLASAAAMAAPTTEPFSSANLRPDIQYGVAGGQSLKLDAYVPPGAGPFPVAILVHGGGWGSGDRKSEFTVLFQPLADANFVWFSIDYRLAPAYHWPACYQDVRASIQWVKTHCADFKGDPARIATIGYSAGAELTFLAAVRATDQTRVAAVVGFAPPTDMVADTQRRGGLSKSLKDLLFEDAVLDDRARVLLREMSPINFVSPNLPPFLIVQGNADNSVPCAFSLRFRDKLKAAGAPCDFVTIDKGPHDVNKWLALDPSYQAGVIDWLNRAMPRAR